MPQRLRIALIAPVFSPMIGGAERLLTNMARALHEEHEVSVFTPISQVERFAFPVVRLRAATIAGRRIIDPISTFARLRRFVPDAIVSSGPDPIEVFLPVIAALLRCPVATMYHADLDLSKPLSRWFNRMHWKILRVYAGVVTLGDGMARHVATKGVPRASIAVIPPGIDEAFFETSSVRARETVLFVGRLDSAHRYKRLDVLLEALALIDPERRPPTVVIGDGPERATFEALASSLGLRGVTFLGTVSDERLRDEYRRARAFVLPSPDPREGFGLVVPEAIAMGALPVITTGHPNADEWCAYGALAVPPLDPAALASTLVAIFDDARTLDAEQRHRVAERYRWKVCAALWSTRLRTMIEQR